MYIYIHVYVSSPGKRTLYTQQHESILRLYVKVSLNMRMHYSETSSTVCFHRWLFANAVEPRECISQS